MQSKRTTRRTFLASTAAAGASLVLASESSAATNAEQVFTILHTNDLHSNLLGVGPVAEYTPDTVGDDATVGGAARIAALLARRRNVRSQEGPVLTLEKVRPKHAALTNISSHHRNKINQNRTIAACDDFNHRLSIRF